ncbi:hypothetical protein C8J56DRAFT_968863 [Mycena floridula]|nr:hypothetical protein C8J56DRAFT_968863 [Mycena floridula]
MSIIAGNAPENIKAQLASMIEAHKSGGAASFDTLLRPKISVDEISFFQNVEEPNQIEAKVVCNILVDKDLLNVVDTIHGGCISYLIDHCSSLAIIVATMAKTGTPVIGLSQSLTVIFHAPAHKGDRLRIVNTAVAVGKRSMTAKTEIWNSTQRRLTASGIHVKMDNSPPKANL